MGKKHRHDAGPTVARTEDVPLRDVSGICLRRGPAGVAQVVANLVLLDPAIAPPGDAGTASRQAPR